MATSTTNLGLTKPAVNDAADIAVLNANFDKIDAKIPAAGAAPVGYATENAWADTYAQFIAKVESVYASMGNMTRRMLTIGLGADGDIARGSWFVDITRFYDSYGLVEIYNENKRYIRKLSGTWGGLNSYDPSAFAPSGYGLGLKGGELPVLDDCHNAMSTGWYHVKEGQTANLPSSAVSGVLRADIYGWVYGVLTLYTPSYGGMTVLQKKRTGDGWEDWEFVNPPMKLGVEYRTTERWQGKPVYTKLLNFGTMPNATNKTVDAGIQYIDSPISITVTAISGTWCFVLPSSYTQETKVLFSKNIVEIETTVDRSNYTAYALLKYTKQ